MSGLEEMMAKMAKTAKNQPDDDNDGSGIADNRKRSGLNSQIDDLDHVPFGELHIEAMDPRSPKSRAYGLYWANKQIDTLLKTKIDNTSFLSDFRYLLTMNPLRNNKDAEFDYVSRIYANPSISSENRISAIRLLSEFDFNVNYLNSNYETAASLATKNGDLKVLTSLVQNGNHAENGDPLGYIDKKGNNLLNIAASNHPELFPFLLRMGVPRSLNNSGQDCVDLVIDKFMSQVSFDPKNAFDKLYISLSSLRKAGYLNDFDKDLIKHKDRLTLLNKRYEEPFKSLMSEISKIQPSSVTIPQRAGLATNIGVGFSAVGGVAYTGSIFETAGSNAKLNIARSKKALEASNVFVNSFNFDKWLESDMSVKPSGFLGSVFGKAPSIIHTKIGTYETLTPIKMQLASSELKPIVSANVDLILDKLNRNIDTLTANGDTSQLIDQYKPLCERLNKLKSDMDTTDILSINREVESIKDQLYAIRTNVAFNKLVNAVEEGRLDLRNIDLSLPMDNDSRDTLLTSACKQNNEQLIDFLLKNNVNLHECDAHGNTPLHIVAKSGNIELINKLAGRWDGQTYQPIPPAKSCANLMILNGDGKTFLDVLHENTTPENYQKILSVLEQQHPMLKQLSNNLVWDVPYWDVDTAQRDAELHDRSVHNTAELIGMNRPELLTDAEWYKKPYPLGSAYTESEASVHYDELKQTIMDISHSLRHDNVDKETARQMRESLSSHLENLPADKLMALTIDSMTSADKYREELKVINQELQSPNLSQDAKATLTKAQTEIGKFIDLKNDIVEKVSNSIMSQLAEGPEERKEALYNSIDKYASQTGGDVTKVLSGLSVMNTENPQHQQIFKNLQDRVSNITAQKYAHLNNEVSDTLSPNNPKTN